jgi:hypothetical protein
MRAAVVVVVLVVGIPAALIGWLTLEFWWPWSLEANHLHGSLKEQSAEFQTRLDWRFPAGSSESELVRVLKKQGFYCGRNGCTLDMGLVCVISVFEVSWESTEAGRIIWLRGNLKRPSRPDCL